MKNRWIFLAIVASLTLLVGCKEPKQVIRKTPPQPIDVAMVAEEPVQTWHTYTTRLQAPEIVALMPRVSGVIESIEFIEGLPVQEGDLLFKLDARPFEAEVARLKAQVASARAAYELAKKEANRAKKLRISNAISVEKFDVRTSIARQRSAEMKAYEAELKAAELDLEFTMIKAPISGVISHAEITKGNNVTANQSVLTSIVSNNGMHAYFDVDERTWNQSFSKISADSALAVMLQPAGSSNFSYVGQIDFIDNAINATTGTLRVRANFKPGVGTLRAGGFARIRVASNEVTSQILIPDRAIGTDLKNRFVLTVNKENVLEYRLVNVGERYGQYRVISAGLKPSDVIAVNGPARVGPGMPITPRTVELDVADLQLTLAGNKPSKSLLARR